MIRYLRQISYSQGIMSSALRSEPESTRSTRQTHSMSMAKLPPVLPFIEVTGMIAYFPTTLLKEKLD